MSETKPTALYGWARRMAETLRPKDEEDRSLMVDLVAWKLSSDPQLKALVEWMETKARHTIMCASRNVHNKLEVSLAPDDSKCDCGLAAALRDIKR